MSPNQEEEKLLPGFQWTPLRFLTGHGHESLAARYASFLLSLKNRRIVSVQWDGEDWIHRWGNNVLVNYRPTPEALTLGIDDLQLFFYDYVPQPGDTVIDVGAGIGTELKVLSELVGPGGRVVAIEADPAAFRRLEKVNQLLGLTNTVLIEGAVGAESGIAHLSQVDLDAIGNFLTTEENPGAVQVDVMTLDSLVAKLDLRAVDYVKMNIEGAERDALKGFTKSGPMVRNWCISCHDFKETEWARTHDFVIKWLQGLGREVREHPRIPGLSHAELYVYS